MDTNFSLYWFYIHNLKLGVELFWFSCCGAVRWCQRNWFRFGSQRPPSCGLEWKLLERSRGNTM